MGKKKSDSSDQSVAYIKTSSSNAGDFTGDFAEDYVKTNLKTSNDKQELVSSSNEDDEIDWLDRPIKSSSKKVTLCTMCGRFEGFQMRRKLFILLCIAIALLIILLSIIIVLYVIVPAIVRSTIEKTELSFRSINIEDIKNDSFRLRAELELSRTGSIPATILSPLIINVDDVGVVRNEQSIKITGDGDQPTIIPIDSPFVVSNLGAFNNFTRSLIFESSVVWHLTAKASIQPISTVMPTYSNIPFNKKVTLNALNGLQNVSIKTVDLRRSTAKHIFVDIIIEIGNPSIFNIDLGALHFSLRYNDQTIGYVNSIDSNITLHSGANAVPFSGELQSKSPEAYKALSDVIENFLIGKTSRVGAVAGPNATSYSLLANGMKGLSLIVPMPTFDEQLIPSLIFNSMSLIPSATEKKVKLSASITFKINSPLGQQSPLQIQTMDMGVFLYYDNNPVGMLNVSEAAVKQIDSITFESAFNDRYLLISGTGKAYEKFAQNFINANKTDQIHFRVVGIASITGSFALGALNSNGISISNDVSLVGLEGLSDVRVHAITVDGETNNALRISINVTIGNSGVTDVRLEKFELLMADTDTGTVIGHVPIDILALTPGSNNMMLYGLLVPREESDLPVVGNFFSAYLNNQIQSVTLFHDLSTSENPTGMDLTISGLSIEADLDGIQTQLIRRVEVLDFGIEFDRANVSRVYVTGELSVLFELPSNVHMTFKALTTSIDYMMRFNNGPNMGQMILHDLPVQHNQTTNELSMNFFKQELIVLDRTSFQAFAADLVLKKSVSVTINGLATALAEVRIGNITLTDIPVSDTLILTGYDRFANGLLHIDEIDLTGAISSNELALHITTKMTNPSVVNILDGGRLSLDLRDKTSGTSLGLVIIDPFYLDPKGNSTILNATGTFTITPKNTDVARQFISRMICGIDNDVELHGILPNNSVGTNVPLLSTAIAGLQIQATAPGLYGDRTLVREVLLKKLSALQILGIPLGTVKTLSTRLVLKNPFSSTLAVTRINVRADYGAELNEDKQVGTVTDNQRIDIGPFAEVLTEYIDVKITAKLATMVSLLTPLLAGKIPLSLTGTIDVVIDNKLTLHDLPLTLLNVISTQDSST
ncbi:hypothetical protein I4U23_003270 [Adineta vaga]|nr:hypothetical protein I4U23_003270 [Adineta vaga]